MRKKILPFKLEKLDHRFKNAQLKCLLKKYLNALNSITIIMKSVPFFMVH